MVGPASRPVGTGQEACPTVASSSRLADRGRLRLRLNRGFLHRILSASLAPGEKDAAGRNGQNREPSEKPLTAGQPAAHTSGELGFVSARVGRREFLKSHSLLYDFERLWNDALSSVR
jgi:hypothetical protein